jgi:AcrR family transcriptional regulator
MSKSFRTCSTMLTDATIERARSSMAKRKFLTDKSERTFTNVLDVSIALFQSKGFHETSMRDISRESGLALGALYYYCRSKEELVLHFYERFNEQIQIAYAKRTSNAENIGQAFTEFLKLKMTMLAKHRPLLNIVLKEAVDRDSPISPFNKQSSEVRKDNIKTFEEMAVRFSKKVKDPEKAGKMLWLLHMAILAFWLYDRTDNYKSTAKLLSAVSSLLVWWNTLSKVPGFQSVSDQIASSLMSIVP